jgi:hypothetical protein
LRFRNFEISSSIGFLSEGLFWDVHNFAQFEGLRLVVEENAAVMRWRVPTGSNPWGYFENKFIGMELYFKNLLFLHVGERDEEMPMTEDTCVSAILKVDPATQNDEPYLRQVLTMTNFFHLLFLFQSARKIEIASETVELRGIRYVFAAE